jgi:hypothetical protein
MASNRSWEAYPAGYRAREMQILANWIMSGESGSVVGLDGSGRSNLLGFLCHRSEVIRAYLPPAARPVVLIPLDLSDLPANNAATLYRVILRAFYQVRESLEPDLQQLVARLYPETRAERDPFLPQSALQELLLAFQRRGVQVALVLNRFDRFCDKATPHLINTLRGLRDHFKDTLCYIVGMRQKVAYLNDPAALGDMYELLDSHVCWVGPMSDEDARWMIAQGTCFSPSAPCAAEITAMLRLSGNFPALLKVIIHWWCAGADKLPLSEWKSALFAQRSIRYRLAQMWAGLTQEEQLVLASIQKLEARAHEQTSVQAKSLKNEFQRLAEEEKETLSGVEDKGLCIPTELGWCVYGDLLSSYVAAAGDQALGRVWMDKYEQIYQGRKLLDMQGLQKRILVFFIKHPYQQHLHSIIIDNAWPEDECRDGIKPEALQTQIKELRRKIEPDPPNFRYIVLWRGKPEGGYTFYPEGRPRADGASSQRWQSADGDLTG